MEDWQSYQDNEVLLEKITLKNLWNALQVDIASIKAGGGLVPDNVVKTLLDRENVKDLKGDKLIKALAKLKKNLKKQAQKEKKKSGGSLDIRVDKPENLMHNIEIVIDFIEGKPPYENEDGSSNKDKTYSEIQDILGKGKNRKRVQSHTYKHSVAKNNKLADTLGKLLAMAVVWAPLAADAAEAGGIVERKSIKEKGSS